MKLYVAVFLLTWYICNAIAHPIEQIESSESSDARTSAVKEFKVHILERGTRFVEKIYIDEQNDIEYFKVPPHNRNFETDHLYDFKMNITVSRVKKDRVCHVMPLPEDLPRPDVLSKDLKSISRNDVVKKMTRNDTVNKVFMRWTRGPKVDKSTLRKEARDFCGQFPVYFLVPFNPDSVSAVNHGINKRALSAPLCDDPKSTSGKFPSRDQCESDKWIFRIRITTSTCIYYVKDCNLVKMQKNLDGCTFKHDYNSEVCTFVTCS